MKTYSKQDWFDVVARTAGHGLVEQRSDKQQFHKWMAVWGMGLVGELKETIESLHHFGSDSQEFHDECGDVFWYIAANSMLLGSPGLDWLIVSSLDAFDPSVNARLHKALYEAIDRLEVVKKIVRDDRFITQQIEDDLFESLAFVYSCLINCCDFNRSIAAVEAKLLKRYPNGYTAEQSINRVI